MKKRVVFTLFCILTLNVYANPIKNDYEKLKSSTITKFEKQKPKQWGEKVTGVKTQFNTKEKVIAITMDACGSKDGMGYDSKLISYLEKENIPATLFINARWIDANMDTFKTLAENPLFEIGNHGLAHKPASVDGNSIYGLKGTQDIGELVDEIEKRAKAMCIQEDLYREGKLKKRTNHCDTKVNNIMFDENGKVLCVIDLDTVMPGFVLSDIGDFIRTGANTGAEDDENLDNVEVNLPIFKAYTRGYMETAKAFLSPEEIKLLPYGGRLLTYMQTVRFLTDYINGDTYYKIHSPKHNLQRTKAQFKLLQSLEANAPEMDGFMQTWL